MVNDIINFLTYPIQELLIISNAGQQKQRAYLVS